MNLSLVLRLFCSAALFYAGLGIAWAQPPDNLIKEANSLFKSENYLDATPKYLQLLSLEPRNSFYNYRYGACLLFNSEKKPDALKYLKFAVTDQEVDPEAHYYLARAYHVNYYYDKAIKSYMTYKGLVKDKTAIKRDLERQIEMCNNGQNLMSKINEVVVKDRKSTSYQDFFRAYNLIDIGGSIVVTEDFQSKIDKKKGHKPVIHLVENRKIIFYSSYGESDDQQKDIYYRILYSNNEWGDPIKLPNSINSSLDEDYPYLDPNEKFLYFSSKGHNSMGGYDIFRIPIDVEQLKFGAIQNLDFAISSPDDDIFYVVDKEYKHAYFASARQSEGGKIHVYRVMVNRFESNMLLLAGDFVSTANPQAKNATIQIKEVSTGKIIEQVKSNPTTGAFSFSLPRGGKYEFIVQTENSKTPQVIPYEAPVYNDSRLIKLNFLEEASGNSVKIRVTQDDYYQFKEDEKNDVLANLFLTKSELLPNVQLQDLLEQSPETEGPESSSEIAKLLNIDKVPITELAQISTQDLNRLKDNYRENEDQKKVYLQMASNHIEKAQLIENQMNVLFEKAETGLTESEILKLKQLDEERTQHIKAAVNAHRISGTLQQQSNYIQGNITKADAVNQKMTSIKSPEDLKTLESLRDTEKTFIKENFNRIKDQDADQILGFQNVSTRLDQIEESTKDYENVRKQIVETDTALTKLRADLESAKKRDKPAIQEKLTEAELEFENLEKRERFLKKQNEKMALEVDSLKGIQSLLNESKTINPNSTSSANSSRLIEAKLKTETSKKINQKTQNTIENATVIPSTNDTASNNTNTKKAEELHNKMQENASKIYALDKSIDSTKSGDLSTKIRLQKEKQNLINDQISALNTLLSISDDKSNITKEIESNKVQLDVSENILAELEEDYALNNPNTTLPSDTLSNNNATNNGSKTENEIADLRKTYNLEDDINTLDKNSDADKLRLTRYASALEEMAADDRWNAEQKAKINAELKAVNQWLDESTTPVPFVSNPQDSLDTSPKNSTVFQRLERNEVQLISSYNFEAQKHADAIVAAQNERDALSEELVNAKKGLQERRILRKIDKKNEEIQAVQVKLLKSEENDYQAIADSLNLSFIENGNSSPIVQSEYFILKQRLDDIQEVISVLKKTNKADRERILVQALNLRDDFMNQLNSLNRQISVQQEIQKVATTSGIDPEFFEDAKSQEYALFNINEEIDVTNKKIEVLSENLSSYSKKEQPRIEQDIEELKLHLDEMEKLKKETQKNILNRKAAAKTNVQSFVLPDISVDEQLLVKMTDNELINTVNDPDFLSIRNDLVSFKLMDIKMQNAVNNEKILHNEMRAVLNLISSKANEMQKSELRDSLNAMLVEYNNNKEDKKNLSAEMQRLSTKLVNNPVYSKNPVLYNTLASSAKIQEVLIKAIESQKNANASNQSPFGLTFVNNDNATNRTENFNLNPVSIPGMIYKIQVGAFNRPIDLSRFSNFEPITTDQVGNSIRYSAGLFNDKNQAFGSLGSIKALGYRDAFVVAYCDGVRYSVLEADELLRQGKCSLNTSNQLSIDTGSAPPLNYNRSPNAAEALALENAKGLLFTVQIGVYNTPRTTALMQNLSPLNTQLTEKNQIRYSVGRFNSVQEAVTQREQAKQLGFVDAFIVAYFNGEKVTLAEAQSILSTQGELALFNNKRTKKLDLADLKVELMPVDSAKTEKIKYLTAHDLQYRLVSTQSYTKAPVDLIKRYRSSNLWVYFDEKQGKLISSKVSSDTDSVPEFNVKPMYQGFVVNKIESFTFQNLDGFDDEETYYNLSMSWDSELPALVAFLLMENYSFVIESWDPENKTLNFAPLSYLQKEKIKKSMSIAGSIRFSESVVTF